MHRLLMNLFLLSFLANGPPIFAQRIQLAADEPFSGQKTFCVELTAKTNLRDIVGNHSFLLTYILSLEDKGIDLTYKLNGRIQQSLKKPTTHSKAKSNVVAQGNTYSRLKRNLELRSGALKSTATPRDGQTVPKFPNVNKISRVLKLAASAPIAGLQRWFWSSKSALELWDWIAFRREEPHHCPSIRSEVKVTEVFNARRRFF